MADKVIRHDSLKKVKFGRTEWLVTEVCGGTMTWGSMVDKEEEAHAELDKLIELGVNFLDTAELYPVSFNYGKTTEEWMGNWLAKRTAEGKVDRSAIYIATKCNPSGMGGTLGDGSKEKPWQKHGYEDEILEASCRASLERLRCGVIDLYQLHWPSRDTPCFGCAAFYPEGKNRPPGFVDMVPSPEDGGMAVFERQVKSVKRLLELGLIREWGLSNENAYGITMFCLAADKLGVQRPVSCQNDFSMLNRTYESDTWEAAYRFGVVGLPYGCLAGGVLTGKYFDDSIYATMDGPDSAAKGRMRSQPDFQPRYGMPVAMMATEKYMRLAEEYGLTPTELALAWAKQRPCNSSVIIGSTTVRQVEECVGAFKLELPEELMSKVDHIHEEFRNPTMFYCEKQVCMDAKWLSGGRHAMHPIK
jgi:aryl-alcohol dehydrogenase-like predicted oxidoreductase